MRGGVLLLNGVELLTPAGQSRVLRLIRDGEFEGSAGRDTGQGRCPDHRRDHGKPGRVFCRRTISHRTILHLALVPHHVASVARTRGDIPLLVDHFVKRFSNSVARSVRNRFAFRPNLWPYWRITLGRETSTSCKAYCVEHCWKQGNGRRLRLSAGGYRRSKSRTGRRIGRHDQLAIVRAEPNDRRIATGLRRRARRGNGNATYCCKSCRR